MNEIVRAKCKLYLEMLKLYDGENVIQEHDLRLMDILMRDNDVKSYLRSKLN